MNREQFAYRLGRLGRSNYDVASLIAAAVLGADSVIRFSRAENISDLGDVGQGAILGATGLLLGAFAVYGGASRFVSMYHSRQISMNEDDYPLEHAGRVVIDDHDGLGFLLDKTAEKGMAGWGTFLRVRDDHGDAVVDKIFDIGQMREEGLITEGRKGNLRLETFKAKESGYNGCHQYRGSVCPEWFGAANYAVKLDDRICPDDWMNLSTFNVRNGPEIIAFNRDTVYLPASNKREFFPATPRRIKAYLRA